MDKRGNGRKCASGATKGICVYLLEAGKQLESWKWGKEMHFLKAMLEFKKVGKRKKASGGRGGMAHSFGFDPYHIPNSHLA